MKDWDFEKRLDLIKKTPGEDMKLHLIYTWVKQGVFNKSQFKKAVLAIATIE